MVIAIILCMLTKSKSFKELQKVNLVVNNSISLHDEVEDEKLGKGRKFISRFIESGIVHYKEFGDVLITKETLDKFIQTMVGCPVIINHKDINENNVNDERVGVVSRVWYDDKDGWYYCEGIIWDKDAISLIKNHNWNVSCSYDFESDFESKTHNGKKISFEFQNGNFLHLALVEVPRYERANIVINSKDEEQEENNGKENVIMTALNELENFVRGIVENACKKEEVKNEKVDKREIIRQIMAIAGKHEDNEDVRTIAKLAEKLAYEKSEDGTADNECKVENEDKRKLIDEIGGILKGKVEDEIIRTIMKKAEELAYEKSEAGTADNKCKNEDEEKEEKFEEEEEIADVDNCGKKAKNEKEEVEEEEIDEKKLEEDKKVENSSDLEEVEEDNIDKARNIAYNGNIEIKSSYITRAERLELGNNY